MNTEHAIRDLFKEAEARIQAEQSMGCPDVVPVWNAINALISLSEINELELELIFEKELLEHKEAPWELVQLCMYHLKLPRFKSLLESQLAKAIEVNDWRAISVLSSILGAYESPWEDYDLYYE